MANNTAISCRRYEENPGKDRSGDAGAGKEHVDLMRRRCVDVPDVIPGNGRINVGNRAYRPRRCLAEERTAVHMRLLKI